MSGESHAFAACHSFPMDHSASVHRSPASVAFGTWGDAVAKLERAFL